MGRVLSSSTVATACAQCEDTGPFRVAPPHAIVEILGYC
jgi:hypothetical protein